MAGSIWCITGGEQGSERRLADALLRQGDTVAVIGRDVAPFALLVDDYADAIMPIELTATTPDVLEEVRLSIELNLGQITHLAVLLGQLGEGGVDEVSARLLAKLERAAERRRDSLGDHWTDGVELVLVRGGGEPSDPHDEVLRSALVDENAEIEARIRSSVAQSMSGVSAVRVRALSEFAIARTDAVRA